MFFYYIKLLLLHIIIIYYYLSKVYPKYAVTNICFKEKKIRVSKYVINF